MTFGERLVELRESRKISRSELAEMLGVPYTTLRNYEKDVREPGSATLLKLSRILDVTVDYLIGGDPYELEVSAEEMEIIRRIRQLSPSQKSGLLSFLKTLGFENGAPGDPSKTQ